MTTPTTRRAALANLRQRSALLRKDSLDICVWANATGDAALKAAALSFSRARRALHERSTALELATEVESETGDE